MRVTKAIREYVENQAMEIYKKREEKASDDFSCNIITPIQEMIDKICEEGNELIQQNLKAMGRSENIEPWSRGSDLVFISSNAFTFRNKDGKTWLDIQNELRNERDKKITEILATLELGGTKADLDEMLRNL